MPVVRRVTPAEEPANPGGATRSKAPADDWPTVLVTVGRVGPDPELDEALDPIPGSPGRRAGPVSGRAHRASARPALPGDVALRRHEVRSHRPSLARRAGPRPDRPPRGLPEPGARCGPRSTGGASDATAGLPGGDGARRRGPGRLRAGPGGQAALGGAAGASSRRAHALRRHPRLLPVLLQPRPGGPRAPRSRPCGASSPRSPSAAWPGSSCHVSTTRTTRSTSRPSRRPSSRPSCTPKPACASTRRAKGPADALAGALLVKDELAASSGRSRNALELNPDSLVYLEWIGWLLTMTGDWERGPNLVRRALDRNPHVIPVAHHALWLAHLQHGGDRGVVPGRPAVPRPDLLPARDDPRLLPRPPGRVAEARWRWPSCSRGSPTSRAAAAC